MDIREKVQDNHWKSGGNMGKSSKNTHEKKKHMKIWEVTGPKLETSWLIDGKIMGISAKRW